MRSILLVLLFFLAASGCLEERLSPSEAQMCLLSTHTQPSLLPSCKTTAECEKELNQFFPAKTYQHVPTGLENIRARKGLSGAWNAIQRASQSLEQIKLSCTTLKAGDLLARAVVSASELQNVLKKTEEAQEFTYRALEKSIAYGSTLELEKVKDTKAFDAYANILQNGHELQTQNPTSEWAQKQNDNQKYFENVARVLAQNKAGTYRVEWSSVFDAYRTGVVIAAPENTRILLAVSPLWQGALGAFLGKYSSSNALGIVTQINANEVIEHAEQIAAPENGLVLQTWKNIQKFDDEISALYENEKVMEEDASQIIEEMLSHADENELNLQKWGEVERSMSEWVKNNEFTMKRGEFWQVYGEWEILRAENDTLREERVNETKPIGERIRERREINRKMEDVKKKMSENEEKKGMLKEQCEKFLEKNTGLEGKEILDAENCLNLLNEAKAHALDKTNATKSEMREELNGCVQSLNAFENALGMEESKAEEFEYYFGSGSINACESARINRENEYENEPVVQEWNEKKKKIESLSKGIVRAGVVWNWSKENNVPERVGRAQKLIRDNKPSPENVLREKIVKMEESIAELEDCLNEVVQEGWRQIKWKVTAPPIIQTDEEETFEAEGLVDHGWGNEIDYPFMAAAPNPGFDSIFVETEGIIAEVVGNELRVTGEYLPGEKIVLRGMGQRVLAQTSEEIPLVKMVGERAMVVEHKTVFTKMSPAAVRVKWNIPPGTLTNSISIQANGKLLPLTEGNTNSFVINAPENETKISIAYELERAITIETRTMNHKNEWGRTFTEYKILARNTTPFEVRAALFTGVSGDPLLTEAVNVTNENGENIPYSLDAVGNIVISNQIIEGNGERKYAVFMERNESTGEWISLMERLRLDVDALLHAENSEVKLGAAKLKNKLNTVRNENDTSKMADKLIEIQTETSALWLREEEYQNEWSALESEWNSAAFGVGSEMNKWLTQGNTALKNRNKQKVVEAIQKIGESRKKENENLLMESSNEENSMRKTKNEMKLALEKVGAYEKALSVGCEKLLQVNFVCPIEESEIRNIKKKLNADKKIMEKLEATWIKLNEEARAGEWSRVEKEWFRLNEETGQTNKILEDALRVLRNAAVERTATLKRETQGNASEDVVSSVEKAALNMENGEFGKSIFVAQSVLNYVNSNKATGLVSIPALAWPFVGIIMLIGGWIFWKEREKKKEVIIPVKTIPKGKTFMGMAKNTSASEPPPMPKEPPLEGRVREVQYIRVRPETLARSEKETLLRVKNSKMRRQKEEPHSPKEE